MASVGVVWVMVLLARGEGRRFGWIRPEGKGRVANILGLGGYNRYSYAMFDGFYRVDDFAERDVMN